jgi:hypothetical protein
MKQDQTRHLALQNNAELTRFYDLNFIRKYHQSEPSNRTVYRCINLFPTSENALPICIGANKPRMKQASSLKVRRALALSALFLSNIRTRATRPQHPNMSRLPYTFMQTDSQTPNLARAQCQALKPFPPRYQLLHREERKLLTRVKT